jgi:hypothetical protein
MKEKVLIIEQANIKFKKKEKEKELIQTLVNYLSLNFGIEHCQLNISSLKFYSHLGCSSMVEYLPSMHQTLHLIASTVKIFFFTKFYPLQV